MSQYPKPDLFAAAEAKKDLEAISAEMDHPAAPPEPTKAPTVVSAAMIDFTCGACRKRTGGKVYQLSDGTTRLPVCHHCGSKPTPKPKAKP